MTDFRNPKLPRFFGTGEPICDIARSYNVRHSTISRLTP